MTDNSAEILFQSSSAGGHHEQFWHGQGCPLFNVDHPAFPLHTMALPILKGALKDGLERLCDMPEPCKFLTLDSYQKRFPWAHEDVDLAQYLVDGLVLQVGGVCVWGGGRPSGREEGGGKR